MKQVVVRRYIAGSPAGWTPACEEQLRMQVAFWNVLVEIERANRVAYRELQLSDPAVASAEPQRAILVEESTALKAERKARRKAARSKSIDDSDIVSRLAELKPLIAAATERVKAAKLAAKDGIAVERKILNDQRFESAKAARQQANHDGLWWGNANAVFASYETARGRAMKDGTELQFHRYTGEGRITNQIQNGGLRVTDLFAGVHPQVSIAPLDTAAYTARFRGDRERLQKTTLSATVYARGRAERANATWPIRMSRPIPDDAMVKQVVVTRRKIASHYRHAVVITATREAEALPPPVGPASPQAAPKGRAPVVAIDLGWRRLTEGLPGEAGQTRYAGLRVGTVLARGGAVSHVICPEKTITEVDRARTLRGQRDQLRNEIVAYLAGLDWSDAPAELAYVPDMIESVNRAVRLKPDATSPFGKLAMLAIRWREYDWRPEWRAEIENWRKRDKRLWEEEANLRDKALYRRLDTYRKAAKEIAETAGVIILEEFNIAEVAKKEKPSGEETEQVKAMRRYRTLAAPGELRKWIIIQAEKRGVPIHYHSGASNNPHAGCGTAHAMNDVTALRQYCPACSTYYDVDENACRNMLAAYA